MSYHETLNLDSISTIARIDPDSISETGLWVAPLMSPGRRIGYGYPAILADVQAGRWVGMAALEHLFADETTPDSAVVELVPSIPGALHRAIDSYPRNAIGLDCRGEPTDELREAASEIGGTILGVALAQPGEANTTVTPLNGKFKYPGLRCGFHVDNKDKKPLVERDRSRRRFIPNRGPGGRLAAFCLPDITTMGRVLGYPEDKVPDHEIYRKYMYEYPRSAVCIGMPVGPGQGSLINTDLILHDGMTIGASQESMTFQVLGNWSRGELARAA
jgi:hypothetical protein